MKILVPTDLSENAKKALNFAKQFAKINNASITLLFSYYAVYDFAAQAAQIIEEIEQEANAALKNEVMDSGEIPMDYKILQGTVSTAIQAVLYDTPYDLIIMGTQGASGIAKTIIGSNTATTIKEVKVPVIAVPYGAEFERVNEITVAIELAKEEDVFFKRLMAYTKNWHLPYEILHVEDKPDFDKDITFRGLESYLRENYPDCAFNFTKIKADQINRGIDHYLKDHSGSLLVMFSKNKTFFENLFNKSHTVEMAYHTHVPMLVLKK